MRMLTRSHDPRHDMEILLTVRPFVAQATAAGGRVVPDQHRWAAHPGAGYKKVDE